MIELLSRLTAEWGPPGREQKVAALLAALIRPHVDEVRQDRLGNLLAVKRGQPGGRRVMLCAHMDTVGGLAVNFTERGLVHLAPVGGLKVHHAVGQRVRWGSGATGVLQHEPVEEAKDLDWAKLWCDLGAAGKEEAQGWVRPGDMCTLAGPLTQVGQTVTGPGLDNRAGCAVLLTVAQRLPAVAHEVVFAFTSQGEIGPRGAGTAAYGAAPDLAFVVDVTTAGDVPKGPRVDVKLGGGPALKLKDGNYMAHYGLCELVRRVAGEAALSLQTEIVASGAGHNDAQVVSLAGQGVPTAVLDIPGRYRGTGAEMVDLRDLAGTADLLLMLLSGPLDPG